MILYFWPQNTKPRHKPFMQEMIEAEGLMRKVEETTPELVPQMNQFVQESGPFLTKKEFTEKHTELAIGRHLQNAG